MWVGEWFGITAMNIASGRSPTAFSLCQTPGPTYNIFARDSEDAIARTKRHEEQVAARKLADQ